MTDLKITSGLEDYIEVISNRLSKYNNVRAIDISRDLGVSRASVSEALRRLNELGYINYGRYSSITITPKGEEAAKSVIFRHNLLTKFLSEVLGLDNDEATDNACKIEHVVSENLLKQLDFFLKYAESNPKLVSDFKKSIK